MLNLRSFRDFPEVFNDGHETAWLTRRERDIYAQLRGPLRQRQWLLGRIATKELVQRFCERHWGGVPALTDISVLRRESGAPYLELEGAARALARGPLVVSIAHKGSYAVSCVRAPAPGHAFGVDIERVERRYPFFPDDLFSSGEAAALRTYDVATADRTLTAYWALKEAAAKAIGLVGDPVVREIEVVSLVANGEAELRVGTVWLNGGRARARAWFFDHHALAFVGVWRDSAAAPHPLERVEEDPVMPEARHDQRTL